MFTMERKKLIKDIAIVSGIIAVGIFAYFAFLAKVE
jgi:hypothetical protein